MRVVTTEMMRELDRITIEDRGVHGIILMERAGAGVAQVALRLIDDYEFESVLIMTGPGNNGGDGWVAAKILHSEGVEVEVASMVLPDKLKGDARIAFERAKEAGVEFAVVPDGQITLENTDLVIDALLGTGATGAPRGAIGEMVEKVIESELPVIAVDNPTGVNSDTGEVPGAAIKALATVTFGLPKLGHFRHPGRVYVGRLMVVDIGIPDDVIENIQPDWRADSTETLAGFLPARPGDGHKGAFGKAAIIAGSQGMSGAAVMAAESCLRSGTGLVELVVPKGLVDTVETIFREAVTKPAQQIAKHRCFSVRALGDILGIIREADAVALGPGIGTHRETVDLIGRILPKLPCPAVIDADGLNCMAKLRKRGIEYEFGSPVIITPHPGELSKLLDIPIDEITSNRFDDMNKWARELGVDILVLKGAPTTISTKEGPVYINRLGNEGMATGGSGDVLTGLICGFLAQGLFPIEAARLGIYIHSLAGDLAAEELGRRGMIAGDILGCVAEAIMDLEDLYASEKL